MTKEELLKELREYHVKGDPEQAHVLADGALLVYINDVDIHEAYGKINKWYS